MSEDVKEWLEGLGLGQYANAFEEGNIDWDVLLSLDHEILKELGVKSPGHRLKVLNSLRALDSDTTAEVSSTPSETTSEPAISSPGEAERRQLTVMFCDLVGSTQLSQRLDPEDLREIITPCLDAWKKAIERYDGFVPRYMGDGLLAYFGFPQAHEDDAERAVRSGLAVVAAMRERNATNQSDDVDLAVRVGIATGPVVVGDFIGEGASQESAVVGETPNLAARLQGLAAANGVVIAPDTKDLLGDLFVYEDLGDQALKGIDVPVRAWRVESERTVESRFDAKQSSSLITYVGREVELEMLTHRWALAKDGEGQVMLLAGEPGIGKSRTALELYQRIAGEPHMQYQCSPHHTNSALYPVATQLERAAGMSREDSPQIRLDKLEALIARGTKDVAAVASLFSGLLSIPSDDRYAPTDLTPKRRREKTLEALVHQVIGLSLHDSMR